MRRIALAAPRLAVPLALAACGDSAGPDAVSVVGAYVLVALNQHPIPWDGDGGGAVYADTLTLARDGGSTEAYWYGALPDGLPRRLLRHGSWTFAGDTLRVTDPLVSSTPTAPYVVRAGGRELTSAHDSSAGQVRHYQRLP